MLTTDRYEEEFLAKLRSYTYKKKHKLALELRCAYYARKDESQPDRLANAIQDTLAFLEGRF